MNLNACEFLPQHKNPVIDQIHNTLFGIVYDYFSKDTKDGGCISQSAGKLIVILDHQAQIVDSLNSPTNVDANPPIAKALVTLMISKPDRVRIGMPYVKEICQNLSDASYNAFMQAIQNQIYLYIHSDRVKATLLRMSQGELAATEEMEVPAVTKENIDSLPVFVPELVNLMLALIPYMFEKRRVSEDKLLGPSQTCMDLLYLSDCVFRLQMQHSAAQQAKEREAVVEVNGDESRSNRAVFLAAQSRKRGVTEWYEFFCLICEAMAKILPVVNYTMLCSNESILNGAWSHSVSLGSRQEVLGHRINECAFFNVSNMAALCEASLTRLRELVVQPDLLNKWHARSSSLDTLLIAASLPTLLLPPHSSSESEPCAEDLALDDPQDDYSLDYEKFLATLSEAKS